MLDLNLPRLDGVAIADRRKYAEILLGFAARASEGAGRVRWSTLAMASPNHLGSRIERILSNRHASAGRLGRRTLVILLLAAPLAAVSTAAVELASREQATSPRSGPVSSTPTIGPQSFAGTWRSVARHVDRHGVFTPRNVKGKRGQWQTHWCHLQHRSKPPCATAASAFP